MSGNGDAFEGHAVLELMGHRRLAGFLSEQQIGGASFLRMPDQSGASVPARAQPARAVTSIAAGASNPYREPSDREREQARTVVGRCVTAFGRYMSDEQARDLAEWVVAGFPWVREGDDSDDDLDPCNHCPHDLTRHRGDGCLDCGCVVPA